MAYVVASVAEHRVRTVFVFGVLFGAACGPPSIANMCDDISVRQCAACYACEIDGATACDLPEGTDVGTCEAEMSARCAGQAATLERPKRELNECDDSLDALSCETLVRAAAQNSPHTTDACVYFL